ncbi:hypothetical protein CBM2592_B10135 [Cupriavidus taiwanensis]|nr:hypothetical protein CBM2592_B10135 [Cupriavidus taiwanensis]SOY91910.1 hypothetical protein CBM2591_B10134 [Cupriavidus taiwanensis]SOZ86011.1 hypothetical protein CBM2622_B10135 [Cupriavidus taiwanensis]SOZ92854.1 hypothetical protein CBM2621_B10135 [Cupriavidus taiwanensis]SPA20821.1 hypothetical protein CBM2631_B220135 [Cupriavidus taiwanensis]
MTALRDRGQVVGNRVPVLATVFAGVGFAGRGTGQQHQLVVPVIQAHALDVADDFCGQAVADFLPRCAAIAAAQHGGIGAALGAPITRRVAGAAKVQHVLVARVDEHGIGVADTVRARHQVGPGLAGVGAVVQAFAATHEELCGVRRTDQHAVVVVIELVLRGLIAARLGPGGAVVRRLQQRALLDAYVQRARLRRMKGHVLDMRYVRRRRERPLVLVRHGQHGRDFHPVLAEVVAAIQGRGLGAEIEHHAALALLGRERVDVIALQAVAARLPGDAEVAADPHAALAVRAGKHQPRLRLKQQRAHVTVFQRRAGPLPGRALPCPLEYMHATQGGDEELGSGAAAVCDRAAVARKDCDQFVLHFHVTRTVLLRCTMPPQVSASDVPLGRCPGKSVHQHALTFFLLVEIICKKEFRVNDEASDNGPAHPPALDARRRQAYASPHH